MQTLVITTVFTAIFALTGLAAGSVEDRLAALEKRVAELEQRLGAAKEGPAAQASAQDGGSASSQPMWKEPGRPNAS